MSERLTDEELTRLMSDAEDMHSMYWIAAVSELRERRAQDLSADEVEALHWAMWSMRDDRDRDGRNAIDTAEWAPRWRRAETLLLKLIAAAEARRG